jgi:uncharacterized DUF497 family protein
MDIRVDTLIVDEHRLQHIARHDVTIAEVREITAGDFVVIQGHHDRFLLIGQTSAGRFLTVVVGARTQPNTYGLVTARPARREERSLYRELSLEDEGGDTHDQD